MYTHDTPDSKGKKNSAYLETGDTTIVPVIYGAAKFKDDYKKVAADIHLGSLNKGRREIPHCKDCECTFRPEYQRRNQDKDTDSIKLC